MANITKAEREKREAADAKSHEEGATIPNPRVPIEPVSDIAPPPVTPAAGSIGPIGTPGTLEPLPEDDPVEAAKLRQEAFARVEMRSVKIIRTYFPVEGGGKKLVAGSETELPIEEARFLIESGVAEAI